LEQKVAQKEFEDDDPMELVGTFVEGDDANIEEMGFTFVEELARMEWSQEEILTVFADPFYRGPHTVYRAKGPEFVKSLIVAVMGSNNPVRKPGLPSPAAESSPGVGFIPLAALIRGR
jgi:hypothetical protein